MDVMELLKYTKDIRLLYVEDDENLRNSTASLFENFFKSVDVAVDGIEGLNKYNESINNNEPYHLIISDIDMPKLNGIEMSKKILEDDGSMSIVFITAHDEQYYLKDSQAIGVKGFMSKPISLEKLCDSISDVCITVYKEKIKA